MQKKVGLIVNPVAGMGGSVGLKGTDGNQMYEKALELGAEPVTPDRTKELLAYIRHIDDLQFFVAPKEMGEDFIKLLEVPYEVVGDIGGETSASDTTKIASQMIDRGIELLIFIGGDGTARDIYDTIDAKVPVVAVPSGVKMFSSVFATNPRTAAKLVDAFVEGTDVTEEEVLDIDEDAFREDTLASRLYGYLLVPEVKQYIQHGKTASQVGKSSRRAKEEIAAYVIEEMDPKTLYLLGPGTTLKAITDELGLPKTLLGIDAVYGKSLVGQDLNEEDILRLFEEYEKRSIIITPIGGNGFIFGRGSKQFTPKVIKMVGKENVLVVSTEQKIRSLDCLRVDTGDYELDEHLSGYLEVTVDYKRKIVFKVKC
ncbi:MAG: ATP-NAD kinase family protein [Anaerolineales bacterium]